MSLQSSLHRLALSRAQHEDAGCDVSASWSWLLYGVIGTWIFLISGTVVLGLELLLSGSPAPKPKPVDWSQLFHSLFLNIFKAGVCCCLLLTGLLAHLMSKSCDATMGPAPPGPDSRSMIVQLVPAIMGICLFWQLGCSAFAGGSAAKPLSPGPIAWEGVTLQLEQTEEAYKNILAHFNAAVETSASNYPFRLEVAEVYECRSMKDDNTVAPRPFVEDSRSLLFHGTKADAAEAIVHEGFRLPTRGGMFGHGIYFADSPMKSFSYCGLHGYILLCAVDLGVSKKLYRAKNALDPGKDLRRSWFLRTLGASDFDSVVGMTKEEGGTLKCREFVVYQPARIVPQYVLKVVCKNL